MRRDHRRLRLIGRTDRATTEKPGPLSTSPRRTGPPSSSDIPEDLAQALRASEQRLSALLEDRGRIGRDLHDCVLQSLYAIGLSLEQSRRTHPSGDARAARPAGAEVVDQLNTLIHDIRRMITGLERGTVEAFDLAAELSSLVATYTQIGPMQIALDLQPAAIDILTGEEEREILNIVREALSNCARHARATQASVVLQHRGPRVRLTIEDNGAGFEPEKRPVAGYGLTNMAARAKRLGGQLTVRSCLGRGTKIIAEFALEPVLTPV
jgi:two-component system, NarL family, sensor kinase